MNSRTARWNGLWLAGGLLALTTWCGCHDDDKNPASTLPNGVAAGDVDATSVVL